MDGVLPLLAERFDEFRAYGVVGGVRVDVLDEEAGVLPLGVQDREEPEDRLVAFDEGHQVGLGDFQLLGGLREGDVVGLVGTLEQVYDAADVVDGEFLGHVATP